MENRKSKKSLLDLRKKFWSLQPLRHSFVNFESNRNISEVNKESINILFEPLEILTWVPHQMSDKLERRDNLENKRDIFFQDENFAVISRWFFLNWPKSTWLSALDRSLATCFQVFKFSHQSCLFKNEFRRIYHRHFASWHYIENATLLRPCQRVLFDCDFRV